MKRFFIFKWRLISLFILFNVSISSIALSEKSSKEDSSASPLIFIRYQNKIFFAKGEKSLSDPTEWKIQIPSFADFKKGGESFIHPRWFEPIETASSPKLIEHFDENRCRKKEKLERSPSIIPIRSNVLNLKKIKILDVYILTHLKGVMFIDLPATEAPTGLELPLYIKSVPNDFYEAMLMEQTRKIRGMLIDYEGKFKKPLMNEQNLILEDQLKVWNSFWKNSPVQKAYLVRAHLYVNSERFPNEITFREVKEQKEFQVSYSIINPWKEDEACIAADEYRKSLSGRYEQQAQNLSQLTGWPIKNIRKIMKESIPQKKRWYQYIWGDQD